MATRNHRVIIIKQLDYFSTIIFYLALTEIDELITLIFSVVKGYC